MTVPSPRPAEMRKQVHRLVVFLVLAWSVPRVAMADLAHEMDSMFNAMASATPPSVFSTARRGVISGGGVAVSNRIVNANLVSITPPSFKAGCGGIDFFAGSFSFINAAQFEALLKAIASNASGYAFQLAMQAMCPTCMNTIETLARKIQEWVSKFSNSCQLAQGIVNDAASAFTDQDNTKASLIGMVRGVASDAFDAFSTTSGSNPVERVLSGAPTDAAKRIQGNVTWRALKKQNASAWFNYGDTALLQILMNIGGTVIVGDLADDTEGAGTQNLNVKTITGRADLIESLIDGGIVSILACDTTDEDGCLNPAASTVRITGFKTMILNAFEGTSGSGGIIDKVGGGVALTNDEQAVLGLLPNGLGGLVIRLSSKSKDAAKSLVEDTAPHIAGLMAKSLVHDMLRAVRASVAVSQDTRAKDVAALIEQSWVAVRSEEQLHQARWGSLTTVVSTYQSLMGATMLLPRGFGNAITNTGMAR
ncbi:Conjugal transfer protein TraH (plasmid) [Rhodovastum atsumiense]|uniref:Conjugal transfer protein TraH n=1 Tax=Rhodovastum atsumiense TaxID=504468 RepID=A0A5M6IK48_9PROT|nr:conjugal transfer protein TraH [Rhodovastum atsumiense]CAH2605976.1 Conjugal transfer protein TraH [Rhodovastum atsumiense]